MADLSMCLCHSMSMTPHTLVRSLCRFVLYSVRLEERIVGHEAGMADSAANKDEIKERFAAKVVRWEESTPSYLDGV